MKPLEAAVDNSSNIKLAATTSNSGPSSAINCIQTIKAASAMTSVNIQSGPCSPTNSKEGGQGSPGSATGGGGGGPVPPGKTQLKTLCFARKSLVMPTAEENKIMFKYGLGCRKWQVASDCDAESFKSMIYMIYPRLASVPGYTLWNLKKDNTFEKLPPKVNTPSRIKAYLQDQFKGYLLIMPLEEIPLVSAMAGLDSAPGLPLHQPGSSARPSPTEREAVAAEILSQSFSNSSRSSASPNVGSSVLASGGLVVPPSGVVPAPATAAAAAAAAAPTPPPPPASSQPSSAAAATAAAAAAAAVQAAAAAGAAQAPPPPGKPFARSFCLVCGRVPKQPTLSGFYDVDTAPFPMSLDMSANSSPNGPGANTISKRLRDILQVSETQRNALVPSKEICKKCFKQIMDIIYLQNQVAKAKEDMLASFLTTVTKVSRLSAGLFPMKNQMVKAESAAAAAAAATYTSSMPAVAKSLSSSAAAATAATASSSSGFCSGSSEGSVVWTQSNLDTIKMYTTANPHLRFFNNFSKAVSEPGDTSAAAAAAAAAAVASCPVSAAAAAAAAAASAGSKGLLHPGLHHHPSSHTHSSSSLEAAPPLPPPLREPRSTQSTELPAHLLTEMTMKQHHHQQQLQVAPGSSPDALGPPPAESAMGPGSVSDRYNSHHDLLPVNLTKSEACFNKVAVAAARCNTWVNKSTKVSAAAAAVAAAIEASTAASAEKGQGSSSKSPERKSSPSSGHRHQPPSAAAGPSASSGADGSGGAGGGGSWARQRKRTPSSVEVNLDQSASYDDSPGDTYDSDSGVVTGMNGLKGLTPADSSNSDGNGNGSERVWHIRAQQNHHSTSSGRHHHHNHHNHHHHQLQRRSSLQQVGQVASSGAERRSTEGPAQAASDERGQEKARPKSTSGNGQGGSGEWSRSSSATPSSSPTMSSSPPLSNENGFAAAAAVAAAVNGLHNGEAAAGGPTSIGGGGGGGGSGSNSGINHQSEATIASRGPYWKKKAFCELYENEKSNQSPPREVEGSSAAGGRTGGDNTSSEAAGGRPKSPKNAKAPPPTSAGSASGKRKGEAVICDAVAGAAGSKPPKRQAYDSGRGTDADEPPQVNGRPAF